MSRRESRLRGASLEFFWEKRRAGAYYFYILDPEFGPAFITRELSSELARCAF